MEQNWLEMKEAAEFLGISPNTMKEWLKSRSPHNFRDYCTRIGRRPIITYGNMNRYLEGFAPKHKQEDK